MKTKLKILKYLGYIKDQKLTGKGQFAKNMYGYELPLSELYTQGILHKLSYRQLGVLCLAMVFEPRPKMRRPRLAYEISSLRNMTTKMTKKIHAIEKGNGIMPLSKRFYYDLSESLLAWMNDHPFEILMLDLEVDEGEVIRFYRMSIQILREMLNTPIPKHLKINISEAIQLINRGVINAEDQLQQVAATELQ